MSDIKHFTQLGDQPTNARPYAIAVAGRFCFPFDSDAVLIWLSKETQHLGCA